MWSDFTKLSWPQERDACGVGFVAHVGGRASHDVLVHGLTALSNLAHRGAVSADGKTGDGAGVLTQLPHRLFRRELEARGVALERDRDLAVGMFFVANDAPAERVYALVRDEIARSPLTALAWRTPPIDETALGEQARARLPYIRQVLLGRPHWQGEEAFERTLYLTRKRIERRLDAMLAEGFLEEVRRLREAPELRDHPRPLQLPALRAVGYRQAWEHLDGGIDRSTFRDRAVFATRQLARRQLTWLRGELDARWFDPSTDGQALDDALHRFLPKAGQPPASRRFV